MLKNKLLIRRYNIKRTEQEVGLSEKIIKVIIKLSLGIILVSVLIHAMGGVEHILTSLKVLVKSLCFCIVAIIIMAIMLK
jgi:succinate dehydrogenase/fumarate reductase cytochrome b subunit